MSKLFPPYIEGALPAFVSSISDKGEFETILKVDVNHNPAVSLNQISGMSLIVKSITDNSVVVDQVIYNTEGQYFKDAYETFKFNLVDDKYKLVVGYYYKVQLAYIDRDNTYGYYSTIGITKYTTQPQVSIERNLSSFIATVSQTGNTIYNDINEKLYSSRFQLLDADGEIKEESPELLHNSNNDDYDNIQTEMYDFGIQLTSDYAKVKYEYTTKNGYTGSVEKELDVEEWAQINEFLTVNVHNGYNSLKINIGQIDQPAVIDDTKKYSLLRAESSTGPWEVIATNMGLEDEFVDYTPTYGKEYYYAVMNDEGISESSEAINYFEDMFLYDGEKMLCVKYNPQVNTFKTVILESKVDTIGGKYPIIYRNGNVEYKELNIGGLISYMMDEEGTFSTDYLDSSSKRGATPEQNFKPLVRFTDLSDENINRKLEFKLQVMNWLNNGKPKLFRSPTEGTYLVRLTNISLTPEKTLGRMLHSFTATAYEIGDSDIKSLKKFGFFGGK